MEALRLLLDRLGYTDFCSFVPDGQQLIDCCAKNLYEKDDREDVVTIVIVEYEMPFMNGLKAIKGVKALYKRVESMQIEQS